MYFINPLWSLFFKCVFGYTNIGIKHKKKHTFWCFFLEVHSVFAEYFWIKLQFQISTMFTQKRHTGTYYSFSLFLIQDYKYINTKYLLHKIIRISCFIRIVVIIWGRVIFEEIRYARRLPHWDPSCLKHDNFFQICTHYSNLSGRPDIFLGSGT